MLGPGSSGRVQVRFSGPDPAVLRDLAGQTQNIIINTGNSLGVRTDWRQPEKVIRPKVLELQANRNGLTRVDVAQALESGFAGRTVGFYREPPGSSTEYFHKTPGCCRLSLVPLSMSGTMSMRLTTMQIWSPVAGRMIPMSQVVSGTEVTWEDPIIMRRDRMPTLTVLADARTGLPSVLMNSVRQKIEQIKLPPGYSHANGAASTRIPTELGPILPNHSRRHCWPWCLSSYAYSIPSAPW